MRPLLSDPELDAADAGLTPDHLMRLALLRRDQCVACAGLDPREEELFLELERLGLADVARLNSPPRRVAWHANRNGLRVLFRRGLAH